jgi:predicted DNA binding protein
MFVSKIQKNKDRIKQYRDSKLKKQLTGSDVSMISNVSGAAKTFEEIDASFKPQVIHEDENEYKESYELSED